MSTMAVDDVAVAPVNEGYWTRTRKAGLVLGEEARQALLQYSWPGNVRELRTTMERLVIPASAASISVADIDRLAGRRTAEPSGIGSLLDCNTFEEFKQAAERAFLLAKLRAFDWNVSETARALDMPRSNLYKKIERYALTRESLPG